MWVPKDPPPTVMPKYAIPKLSKEEIRRRAKRIRPVFRKGGKPFYVEGGAGFTFSPKYQEEAIGLIKVRTISTLYTWGYYGTFAPDYAELLAQVPDDLVEVVVAAEITKQPETVHDLNQHIEAVNAGFHVAETTFYKLDTRVIQKEALKPKTPFAKAILGDDPFKD